MEKSLLDQLNYYYTKNEDQIFYQFKTENKDYLFTSQYLNYFKKCQDIIDSLESKNIEVSLDKLKNSINEMTNKLNETTRIMKDLQKAEKNFQNKSEEKGNEEFASIYAKEAESILSKITENLSKIRKSTYSSEFEMMSDAKKINNSKTNELKLQQLKNTLTENIKSFQYSLKEKNSKIVSVENKQNTLNDNKLKIEKLKQEFNSNSERMTAEIAENEKYQREIDALLQELENIKKEENLDEHKEQTIKDEEDKLDKILKDNELAIGELIEQKNKVEKDLEKKMRENFGMFLLNYYIIYKINRIKDVNNYNYCLNKKLMNLKELSSKLGIKSAKVQDETSKVDKRAIKYQLFLQVSGNDII
jgi:chromosome segregation ATPase